MSRITKEALYKEKYREQHAKIREEIRRLKKWESSLDVRYAYHAQKYWRLT